jgi:hypothetical protein
VDAIRDDFSSTRMALAEAIATVEKNLGRTRGYGAALKGRAAIPTDSLRVLFAGTFAGFVFQPQVSSYDGAVSSGSLSAITTPDLRAAFTQFDKGRSWWLLHLRTLTDVHYGGPTWELRKELGSEGVLGPPEDVIEAFRLSDTEARTLLTSRRAFATAEVHAIIYSNILYALREMDAGAEGVLEALGPTAPR